MNVPAVCCPSVTLSIPHLLQHYMQYGLTNMHYLHRDTSVRLPLFFTSLHHMRLWELPGVVTDLMLMGRLYLLACTSP